MAQRKLPAAQAGRGGVVPGHVAAWRVAWPAAVDGLAGTALAVLASRAAARAAALPWREGDRIARLRWVSLALTLNALFQAVLVAVHLLPRLLDADLGDGRLG